MREVSNLSCALALGHQLHPPTPARPQAGSLVNAPAHGRSDLSWWCLLSGFGAQPSLPPSPARQKGLPPAGLPECLRERNVFLSQVFLPAGARSLPSASTHKPSRIAEAASFISSCLSDQTERAEKHPEVGAHRKWPAGSWDVPSGASHMLPREIQI